MTGIKIVTDSACDLSSEMAEGAGVRMVPLTIRFGEEEFYDREELSPHEFWKRCTENKELPGTAAPSPGAFQTAFDEALCEGASGIICLTLSSEVSATYQSALKAAEALESRIPIKVIDSRTLTMGQGLLCLSASDIAKTGARLEEVASKIEALIPRTHVFGSLGALDHLQRGGRIGGAAALVGSLLSIKPVICVEDGKVEKESTQRTRSRALDYLVKKVALQAELTPLERIAVCNGAASDIDSVIERLHSIPSNHELVVVDLGPVVGTHAGPETIGLCYQTGSK